MVAYKNVSFDDRDTDHLRYGGGWFLTGSWNATHVRQTGTLASANDLAANVTFTFPMPATAFYYYGIPRCCGGLYAICVDCDPENPQFIPINAVNATDDGQNPPVVLYSVQFDTPGVHEIILTNQNDPTFGKSQITIDRFDLEVVDENAPDPVTTPVTSLFATSTSPAATAVGANATSSSSSMIPAIIGGCVGGLALLAILVFLFIWLTRRRSRRTSTWDEPQTSQFNYAPRVPSESPYYTPEPSTRRQSFSTMRTATTGSAAPTRQQGHWTSPSMSATSAAGSNPFTPMRETDAGRVMASSDDSPTLPPEYEQVFSRGQSRNTYHSEMASNSGTSVTRDSRYPTRKS